MLHWSQSNRSGFETVGRVCHRVNLRVSQSNRSGFETNQG